MEHAQLDTRLMTIEEMHQDIQNMLHQHSQWQEEVGDRLTNIQQHQQQENENWSYLFQKFNFDPPFWSTTTTSSLGEEDPPLSKVSFLF